MTFNFPPSPVSLDFLLECFTGPTLEAGSLPVHLDREWTIRAKVVTDRELLGPSSECWLSTSCVPSTMLGQGCVQTQPGPGVPSTALRGEAHLCWRVQRRAGSQKAWGRSRSATPFSEHFMSIYSVLLLVWATGHNPLIGVYT